MTDEVLRNLFVIHAMQALISRVPYPKAVESQNIAAVANIIAARMMEQQTKETKCSP